MTDKLREALERARKAVHGHYGTSTTEINVGDLCELINALSLPAAAEGGERALDELQYKFDCFIDFATGGQLSKSSWALETLKAAVTEFVNATVNDAVDEAVQNAREDFAKEAATPTESTGTQGPSDFIDHQQRRGAPLRFFVSVATHAYAAAATRDDVSHEDAMRVALDAVDEARGLRPSPVPEGCTPADARMLRAANHGLAEQSHEIQETLRDLLAQVTKFCEEQGEADFETGRATELLRRLDGLHPLFACAPTAAHDRAAPAPTCAGDPGECAFHEACMYQCQGEQPMAAPAPGCSRDPASCPNNEGNGCDCDPLNAAPAQAVPGAAPKRELRAVHDVVAERRRQCQVEGWTPMHDDSHRDGSLAKAASCYAWSACGLGMDYPPPPPSLWPWDSKWWKPKDSRSDLVRAGALILAEIERLDRADGNSFVDALASRPAGGSLSDAAEQVYEAALMHYGSTFGWQENIECDYERSSEAHRQRGIEKVRAILKAAQGNGNG